MIIGVSLGPNNFRAAAGADLAFTFSPWKEVGCISPRFCQIPWKPFRDSLPPPPPSCIWTATRQKMKFELGVWASLVLRNVLLIVWQISPRHP